jgi:hypothetical protein
MKRFACEKLAIAAVLGDLEADLRRVDAAAMEVVDHERQELVVAEALPGQVDRAQLELLALVRFRDQPAQRVLDHPAVDVAV